MNKIDNIKSYNQVMLAIGSTLTVLFILVMGLFILSEEWNRRNNDFYQEGVLSTQATKDLLTDSLRKQVISFNSIELVDSASKTYLLPVRQADLIKKESTGEVLGLVNTFTDYSPYYKHKNGAAFNNLVIYESLKNKSEILFKERIGISSYQKIEQGDEIYLLIIGTNQDSNKDQYLNSDDLQDLFIYDVEKQQLTKITTKEKFTTLSIVQEDKTKEVIGKFGLDRNNDGQFHWGKEPMVFYKINIVAKQLVKLVKDDQILELQKLLEGSKS